MADSTLDAIRTKVRRLTRTPSQNQMTDATMDEYINTFVLYDFPEHLRTFTLRTRTSFFTTPYVDQYPAGFFPLTDFPNKYINVFEPVYISGYKAFYSQSPEQFYNIYPVNRTEETIGTGDGGTTTFSGTLNNTELASMNVAFSYYNSGGDSESFKDATVRAADGPAPIGNLYTDATYPSTPPTAAIANSVNYDDGTYSITFSTAPASGTSVIARYLAVNAARPIAVLYWNNTFTLRPVPDDVYEIVMEVDRQPTELLADNQSPDIEQWWQYIAYGASKKILEDRMDIETVAKITPEFKMQERLALRRTLVQNKSQRTPTIYTEQASLGADFDNFNGLV